MPLAPRKQLVSVVAFLLLICSGACSKLRPTPPPLTGSDELESLCSQFGADHDPVTYLETLAANPLSLEELPGSSTGLTGPSSSSPHGTAVLEPLTGLSSWVRLDDMPPGFADHGDAFNEALTRLEDGDDPAQVIAEYRPASGRFMQALEEPCEPLWSDTDS